MHSLRAKHESISVACNYHGIDCTIINTMRSISLDLPLFCPYDNSDNNKAIETEQGFRCIR
jgi:hypothetical protein